MKFGPSVDRLGLHLRLRCAVIACLGALFLCLHGWCAGAQPPKPAATPTPLQPGQRSTLLPNGDSLITGLPGGVLGASGAAIRSAQTSKVLPLPTGPARVRDWHTATMLPDGTVLLLGGVDAASNVIEAGERFNPSTRTFSAVENAALLPRAHQSATLLTDGRVLITGGFDAKGSPVVEAELWNSRTQQSESISAKLNGARLDAVATLAADGSVWLTGGVDANGKPLAFSERFDPFTQGFSAQTQLPPDLAQTPIMPQLAGTIPEAEARNITVDSLVGLRFNKPLRVDTLNAASVQLVGPKGAVAATVVPTEAGRLVFVTPTQPLEPGTAYTQSIVNAQDGVLPHRTTELRLRNQCPVEAKDECKHECGNQRDQSQRRRARAHALFKFSGGSAGRSRGQRCCEDYR
jgi:hypothetical protein